MTSPYARELYVAELAVQRATLLTKAVFHEKAKGTLSKDDKSPVTVADFGAQALIIAAIRKNFPDDEIVGEEEASTLRENDDLRSQIWNLVKGVRLDDAGAEEVLGGPVEDEGQLLEAIDAGNGVGGARGRIWALDPVDGTKGFLRGGQYAVCLALIVDGNVQVGVLGCPNLPVDDSAPLSVDSGMTGQTDGEGRGVLFSAVSGQGAASRPLGRGALGHPHKSIAMRTLSEADISAATFCESFEAGHSSHSDTAAIAARLTISRPSVRMDSQAKYGSIARAAGDVFLRLPVRGRAYVEKIWDHAAGDLIVREAGGVVSDVTGKPLDFGLGRTLKGNTGVVAAPRGVHAKVLEAVRAVLAENEGGK
ncbi:MAG: hypothetical protein M1832_006205 [Thelocarpon impressellum]|nr:MAG: hypothetical protein M1832_006205 [Thelocarpon impressellum]